MGGFVSCIFEFVFGEVLFGEVTEGGVGVFRGMLVFPRAVRLVVLPAENAFELIFAYLSGSLH